MTELFVFGAIFLVSLVGVILYHLITRGRYPIRGGILKRDYMGEVTAKLGISRDDLLARIRELHPERDFANVYVIADEEMRYVAIATYVLQREGPQSVGHPPSLAFAISKRDGKVTDTDHSGYGLGIC